jgi:hypothetical protein
MALRGQYDSMVWFSAVEKSICVENLEKRICCILMPLEMWNGHMDPLLDIFVSSYIDHWMVTWPTYL